MNHIPIPFDEPLHGGTRTENISDNPDEKFLVRIKAEDKDINISVSSVEDPEGLRIILDCAMRISAITGW